jgi:Zn-dependent peptidase ImmA (M78 family)
VPQVNPAVLRWARTTAGLQEAEAAAKINLAAARGQTAEERLQALEEGDEVPSRPLLLRMAHAYRRPLLTFYLSKPPRVVSRGEDFRTLPDEEAAEDEPVLDALLRGIQARQGMVRAALEDEGVTIQHDFVGSASMDDGVDALVENIREQLDLPLTEFRKARTAEDAFDTLRAVVERKGVFVLLVGDLGSHHSALDAEVFRGFALADNVAPFIVINDRDARAAWSFTLMHELAHIWLGYTGVSGGSPEQRIERFCNDVASEYLLPEREAVRLEVNARGSTRELAEQITGFASRFRVSSSLVAYKIYRLGKINVDQWRSLRRYFKQLWLSERERRRGSDNEDSSGPTYYVVRRHRIGKALLSTTARLMANGDLTTSKAAIVLGVKPNQVSPLMELQRPRKAS